MVFATMYVFGARVAQHSGVMSQNAYHHLSPEINTVIILLHSNSDHFCCGCCCWHQFLLKASSLGAFLFCFVNVTQPPLIAPHAVSCNLHTMRYPCLPPAPFVLLNTNRPARLPLTSGAVLTSRSSCCWPPSTSSTPTAAPAATLSTPPAPCWWRRMKT